MDYTFLVDTYASERLKTLSVWAMFDDADLDVRPHPNLARDRTFREHMVHQCFSEDKWFTGMFGIDVGAPPLADRGDPPGLHPPVRRGFREATRPAAGEAGGEWWAQDVAFFDTIAQPRVDHGAAHRAYRAPSARSRRRC